MTSSGQQLLLVSISMLSKEKKRDHGMEGRKKENKEEREVIKFYFSYWL